MNQAVQLKQAGAGPSDPLPLARAIAQNNELLRWQGAFWQWNRGAYSYMTEDEVRALAYQSLDMQGEKATRNKVSDVLDALRAVVHLPNDVEPPQYLTSGEPLARGQVALQNGVLDLSSGELADVTPDLFTLSALPVDYDPNGDCPEWKRFLFSTWGRDPQAIGALQELFGYLISGETNHQKIFIIVGPMRSGKGTIFRVLTALLGRQNVAAPTLASLSQPFGLQPLIGKLAGLVSDARLSGRADQESIAERLLSVSGEDHVSIPRKFLPDFTAQLQARFVLATNELPRLNDASGALASRFVPLVLTESFLGNEDKTLTDRLLAELPGILNWAIQGYRRLNERGYFEIPESAADAVQELYDLGSPISAFLRDCCVVEHGAEVGCSTLYDAWREWCTEHGRDRPGTEQTFGRDLKAAAPAVRSTQVRGQAGKRVRVYRGVRLDD